MELLSPPALQPHPLGSRLRGWRRDRDWTLEQAAQATGLARSTLSKIENGQMSPTYDALLKLAHGFGVDISQLFGSSTSDTGGHRGAGRRSITRAGQGQPFRTPAYDHQFLCNDLSHKSMIPFRTVVTARHGDDAPAWSRHAGEEMFYVLDGEVDLLTEFYEPERLRQGDCAYLDSLMGHRLVSVSPQDAVVLWVSTTHPRTTPNTFSA